MKVEMLLRANEAEIRQINVLLSQLSSSAIALDSSSIAKLLSSEGHVHFVARHDTGELCGMLSLIYFRIPTGLRARIEDVVVLENHRQKGIAKELCARAIGHYLQSTARTLDLTSSPSRDAANQLYTNLGFERRNTNVFRYNDVSAN